MPESAQTPPRDITNRFAVLPRFVTVSLEKIMLLTSTRGRSASLFAMVLAVMVALPAGAQDRTAAELLQQGLEQFEQGNIEQARQTLEPIDRVQLNDSQQQRYDRTLEQINAHLQARQTLADARAAEEAGDLQRAKERYRQLTANTAAPRELRQQALNSLARVEAAIRDNGNGNGGDEAARPAPQPAAEPMTAEGEGADEPADAGTEPPAAEDEAEAATDAQAPTEEDRSRQLMRQAMQLRAQQLVAEANAAAEQGNYNQALRLYERAAAMNPDNEAAQRGLANVRMVLAEDTAPSILENELTARRLKQQRAVAQYNNAISSAEQAMEAGNYARASDEAALAKSILDTNRQFFSEDRYTERRQQALDLAQRIETRRQQAEVESLEQEQQRIAERQAEQRQEAEMEQQRRVQELLRRARDLARDQRYDQALEQIEQIKFIEPGNTAALFMEDLIEDQVLAVEYRQTIKERGREMAVQTLENVKATVPTSDLLVYPPDWPELTARRLETQGQATDTEANRVVRERLQQPIPVDFRANALENVIEFLRNVTGVNIFVQWNSLEAAGVSRDTPITMQLQNVAAAQALQLILDEAGGDLVNIGYTINEGVVVIATQQFLSAQTTILTYDIRDLIVQVPSFDEAPEFDLGSVASDSGGGGGGIFDDAGEDDEGDLPRAERIQQIMDLIRNTVDPDNWRMAGGLTSSMEELNGTLIVTTTAENHEQISGLLRQLREQRAIQIAVESRFLFVTQNFIEEVGLDVDFTLLDPGADVVGTPTAQGNTADTASALGTTIDGTLGPLNDATRSLLIGSALPGGGVGSLGFLIDDLRVDVLLKATQRDSRNLTVNTPRITFFNGQRAYVTVSRQVAFVSDLEPVVAENAVAFDPEIDIVSDGIVLDVEGTISADRRYVTLTVRPSLAQLTNLREFTIFSEIDQDDDDDDGDEDQQQFAAGIIQQPEIQLTTLRTTVSVPDKGTLLLGGQRLVGEVEVESGVPVLSKIPFINRLFTNRSTTRDERTLLILIKPTIIIQAEEEERLFPGLQQAPDLYPVGVQP